MACSQDTGFSDTQLDQSQEMPINKINDYLFIGSVEARDPAILLANQIKYVIRITTEVEASQTNYPLPDTVGESIYYLSDDPMRFVTPTIKRAHYIIKRCREENKVVLVHCEAGISRSASVVIGHLMIEHKIAAENALKMVELQRPCVWPNESFWRQLVEFEEEASNMADD